MARALSLARRGVGDTDPNPRVGCVLVRAARIVGEGWHQRCGGAHAEVHALAAAGPAARGAVCYVTLEPCAHTGRTPPCTEALIAAGVARVVIAVGDPNPLVGGRGIQRLRAAGMAVTVGVLQHEAEILNAGFLQRMQQRRPRVRIKLATTLDGRTATAAGESQWITSPAARADVQRQRAQASAILTGVVTVLADDPRLTVRPPPQRIPLRVVADSQLRTPLAAALFQEAGPVLLVTTDQAPPAAEASLRARGAEVLRLPGDSGRVPLRLLLQGLAERGVNEVWTEAGPTLAGALVAQGLADEIVLYVAPKLLGLDGRGLFDLPAIRCLEEAIELRITEVRSIGPDLRITAEILRR